MLFAQQSVYEFADNHKISPSFEWTAPDEPKGAPLEAIDHSCHERQLVWFV
jgi:hypothetical protein